MNSVFLVYKTDSWHSYASRDTIGIGTDEEKAFNICEEHAKKEGETFDNDQIFNLNNLKQTQGYSGDGEFQYEEIKLNILL